MEKKVVRTYRDLNVYQQSFELAMAIFEITKAFPAEERYGLTDQVRRSSRSIPSNLAEGWAKRKYPNVFRRHLFDAIGSCEEVKVWLDFAFRCQYIGKEKQTELQGQYAQVGAMLFSLENNWK